MEPTHAFFAVSAGVLLVLLVLFFGSFVAVEGRQILRDPRVRRRLTRARRFLLRRPAPEPTPLPRARVHYEPPNLGRRAPATRR